MSMIVITDQVMCCTECGGFHFLAYESRKHKRFVVRHPDGEMYKAYLTDMPCPNIGKLYFFPPEKPVEAIEVSE